MRKQIYYRGSLNFCNYSCSYCPFSKKKYSEGNLQRDRSGWFRFVEEIMRQEFGGAIQVVPYGEALVHEYYWQGLAELSRCDDIKAVGAQSNFSFSVEKMLCVFEQYGGRREKLRLWGTFHPEMTATEEFLSQCRALQKERIQFCVGSVGVPENIDVLRSLRKDLDAGIYMWVNKMEGLGRRYREEEIQAFMMLDRYFELELRCFEADAAACRESLLVEGDGTIRPCALCHQKLGNLYQSGLEQIQEKKCTKHSCDCFLSYGGRSDIPELTLFQPFPAFRIPDRI